MAGVQCIVDVTPGRAERLTLVSEYVQTNIVSSEWRIDRLKDELPRPGHFKDCSEQILSQLKGAIIAQRVLGGGGGETVREVTLVSRLYLSHSATSLQHTR